MNKPTLVLLSLLMLCTAFADAQSLFVRHRDGTATAVPLSANPLVQTGDATMSVTSVYGTQSFDNDDVLGISFQTRRSDVNRDFHVDISDVVSVINDIADPVNEKPVSDVNADGKADISDIVAIINDIAGTGKETEADIPVFAPDNLSDVGDAVYVYRNDGEFNAFLRYEVEQITFGRSMQVQTPDSTYSIPLAAIDSVSFIQPQTIYKPGTFGFSNQLYSYVKSVDGLNITFYPNTPLMLLPKQGDDIAALEMNDKFPLGFAGHVHSVDFGEEEITVACDSINISDVVEQFYRVVRIDGTLSADEDEVVAKKRAKSKKTTVAPFVVDIPEKHIPVNLSGMFNAKNILDFGPQSDLDIYVKPSFTGTLTEVCDLKRLLYYINLHGNANVDVRVKGTLAGSAGRGFLENLGPIIRIPSPASPFFIKIGPKLSLDVTLAAAFNIDTRVEIPFDLTLHPLAELSTVTFPALSILSPLINRVSISLPKIKKYKQEFSHVLASGEAKIGIQFKAGLGNLVWKPFGKVFKGGWVGIESEFGVKGDFQFMFGKESISKASDDTGFYDSIKDESYVSVGLYAGVRGVAELSFMNGSLDDVFKGRLEIGRDFDIGKKFYESMVIPHFYNVRLAYKNGSSTTMTASADISKGGLFPFSVGFAIFDDEGNRIKEPVYFKTAYKSPEDLPSYSIEFAGMGSGRKYRAYPVIKLFGYDVLASPYAELETEFPVVIRSFEVTKSQYKKGSFYNDGTYYDYRFDAATSVTCTSTEGLSDWGYVYEDPNGRLAHISLKSKGSPYTDTSYAYFRNSKQSTCRLYGYVKYDGDDEYYYGEPRDYELKYEEQPLCPDSNHPHAIDLGIGVKWACCNVGASSPEQYGGYYAWGETEEKSYYDGSTYKYYNSSTGYQSLGSDIAGTQYDVAHVKWGSGWRMPSLDQIKTLINSCTSEWTSINGVYGRKVTGANGGSIFLPAACDRWFDGTYYVGSYGNYWSSTQNPGYAYYAYYLNFFTGNMNWSYDYRYYGRSVRPVTE